MAAGTAAMNGHSVLLMEKMEKAGRKIRITGKGRCNLTNARPAEEFLEKVRRGFPNDNQYTEDYAKKAGEYFFALNKRTKEKEAIINQLKA